MPYDDPGAIDDHNASPDDQYLFKRFRDDGCQEALAELFNRHLRLAFCLARRAAPRPEDAEDIIQQVFLDLLAAGRRLNDVTHPRAWLMRSITNACAKARRRSHREFTQHAEMDDVTRTRPAPIAIDNDRDPQLDEQVRGALQELPECYRLPLTLRFLDGLPLTDIAVALERQENVVRKQISRGLERLRQHPRLRRLALSHSMAIACLGPPREIVMPRGLSGRLRTLASTKVARQAGSHTTLISRPLMLVLSLSAAAGVTGFLWLHQDGDGRANDHSIVPVSASEQTTGAYDIFFPNFSQRYAQDGFALQPEAWIAGEDLLPPQHADRILNASPDIQTLLHLPDELPTAFVITFETRISNNGDIFWTVTGADSWTPDVLPPLTRPASEMATAATTPLDANGWVHSRDWFVLVGRDGDVPIYEHRFETAGTVHQHGWQRGQPKALICQLVNGRATIRNLSLKALLPKHSVDR